MGFKAMDLYDAYNKNMLPKEEGYVVSAYFVSGSPYSIYEIISYAGVKNFYASGDSITFQSDGKKIYILVEPTSYTLKAQEPYVRPQSYQIPMRFNELEIYTCRNQYKLMYSKEAQMVMTSFTVMKPTGSNFSFIIFPKDDIEQTITLLFQKAFNGQSNVPLSDAKKVAESLAQKIMKELSWPNKEKNVAKAKASPKAKPGPKPKAAAKPAEKAKPGPKPKAAAKPAEKAKPGPKPKVAAKPAEKAKPGPKPKAAAKPAEKAKPGPKPKAAAKPAEKAKPGPKPKAAAKPTEKAKPGPKPKVAAKPAEKAKPGPKPKAAAKPAEKAKPGPKPKAAAKTIVKKK